MNRVFKNICSMMQSAAGMMQSAVGMMQSAVGMMQSAASMMSKLDAIYHIDWKFTLAMTMAASIIRVSRSPFRAYIIKSTTKTMRS